MDAFFVSSFGTFVMGLFHSLFTAPAWQSFALLACGWALTTDRHTITTYVWLTGATTVKHFSRFYVFLGCPLYSQRWHLWGRSSARQFALSPKARSLWSLLTIRPRKRPVAVSRGSAATVMALARPGKNSARCEA